MPTTHLWKGTAPAVKQVSTVQITANDAATTYTITIGDTAVSVAGNAGGANDTASDMADACAASTHPNFTAITFTSSTDSVVMTAKNAGIPFTATSSKSGGTGTIGGFTTGTANAGPNVWAAANFSSGAMPASGDTVIFENSPVHVLWELDQNTVTLAELRVMASYTGMIGLPETQFATSTTASTTTGGSSINYNATVREYRDTYLKISATALNIGQGSGNGSGRIKINVGSNQTATTVYSTGMGSADDPLQPVRLLGTHVSNTLAVFSGAVGVATTSDAEIATLAAINQTGGAIVGGPGLTWTYVNNNGGTLALKSAGSSAVFKQWSGSSVIVLLSGTVDGITNYGGTLTLNGTFDVTTLNATGGNVYVNSVTTFTDTYIGNGAVIDTRGSRGAVQFTNIYYRDIGGDLIAVPGVSYANNISASNTVGTVRVSVTSLTR